MKRSHLFPALFLAASLPLSPGLAQGDCLEMVAGVCLKFDSRPSSVEPAPARPAPVVSPAAREERALQLTRQEVRQIQAELKEGGYYQGPLDGQIGPGSRRGISRWQSRNGYEVTGYLTFDQILALKEGRQPTAPAPAMAQPTAPAPAAAPEPTVAAQPEPGRTYRFDELAPHPNPFKDPFTVELKIRRVDDESVSVSFRLMDGNEFNFAKDCAAPVAGDFKCTFAGPKGGQNRWFVEGAFPTVALSNGYTGFSRKYALWD